MRSSSQKFGGGFVKASSISRNETSTLSNVVKFGGFQKANLTSNIGQYTSTEKAQTNSNNEKHSFQRSVKTYKENKKKKKKKKKNQITSFFSRQSTTASFVLHTSIVGIGFGNRERLTHVPKQVELIREPRNKVDRHALMVVTTRSHIGYVPKQEACLISPALDINAVKILSATVPEQKTALLKKPGEITRLPLVLRIREIQTDESCELLKSHAEKSRKREERAVKKNNKRKQDQKFVQHSIMSFELKRKRKQKMPTSTSILRFREIPPAVWRLLFYCGGLNVRDFGRVKVAWRVWNDALDSKEYLKYYFLFSQPIPPVNVRTMMHSSSSSYSISKDGLMRIVIDVRLYFRGRLCVCVCVCLCFSINISLFNDVL
ncbi:HIRAN domain-containing protein [bacterium]|nr:HIRAN domain-containing protein [bacterium]